MRAIAGNPDEYRFTGPESVQLTIDVPEAEQRFFMLNKFFNLITDE